MSNLYHQPENDRGSIVHADGVTYLVTNDRAIPVQPAPVPDFDSGASDVVKLLAVLVVSGSSFAIGVRLLYPPAPVQPPAPVVIQPQPVQVNPGCVLFCGVEGN